MTKFLTVNQVIEIHDTFLEGYGGLPGIRSRELLLSAVDLPKMTAFGEDLYATLFDKAAVYLYHIVKNHPFNDGNKRTGAGVALMFLRVNGERIDYDKDLFVQLVMDVASGNADKDKISEFLKTASLSERPKSPTLY